MTDEQTQTLRDRLDNDLSLEAFERNYRSTEEAATQFFQDLFIELLNFEETPSPLGDATWQDLPAHEWPADTRARSARLFAQAGNFRTIYVELEKLTRTAERNTIKSLTRSESTGGWAIEGSFLVVFHAPDDDTWHLVTPYEEDSDDITTGRPVLRRYTLGEGETHRTVSDALAEMDASKPGRLAGRIDEAFRVQPVTEKFYDDYKDTFQTLSTELRNQGLDLEDADQYAHITLNRLMFFYYLQKKGWIGDRKDFVRWFHEQYQSSDETDSLHEEWFSALFFDGMNQPEGTSVNADIPDAVADAISNVPYMNGGLFEPTDLDQNSTYLSDDTLDTVLHGFLEQYNFTVTEESPYDIDVAVDPAMLGKIYESLIAEQERGEAGIFYTPRVEVDLMCRLSLYEQFCDYANNLDESGRRQIINFLFSEPQDWNPDESGDSEALEEILHDLRIVDPACGSGAFLVGMKQVITELYRKLGATPNYQIKEQIINENLYGVDIKDWAIRVAEFRLWLSLVEGEDELPDQRPVLPNFSFKLKVGDSLIQKLDGEFVSLDAITRTSDDNTGELLDELKRLKREHFEGDGDRTDEIEEKQVELLQAHIDSLIDNLTAGGTQDTLFGEANDDLDKEVRERVDNLREVRDAIDDVGDVGFFMWDIDFSDVMVEGGFDVVIGNPPYVRQEDIVDQGIHPERLETMDDSEVKALKKQYKDDLVAYVEDAFDLKPYKRSDIYVYFYFKGLELLRDRGTLTYITSNSWLDVNYGQRLQEGLLRFSNLQYLLDNRAGPIFDEADVNTIITIAERTAATEELSGETSFVTLNDHYENLVGGDVFEEILLGDGESSSTIKYRNETLRYNSLESGRRVALHQAGLWRLGGGAVEELKENGGPDRVFSEQAGVDGLQAGIASYSSHGEGPKPVGSYSGEQNWSTYLQAPDIYFKILNQNQGKIITLDEVANIFRGTRTGNNTYFYPSDEVVEEFDLPSEFLYPIVKSPRPLNRPLITPDELDTQILLIPQNTDNEALKQYIEYGKEEGYHTGSSAGDPWYSLVDEVKTSRIFWQESHYTKHIVYYSETPHYLDQQFYGILPNKSEEIDETLLAAILNCSFYALIKILYGREMSGRSIKATATEVAKFPIPDPSKLSSEEKDRIRDAFKQMEAKESGAIYDEFDDPHRECLDEALFDILGLTDDDREAVYEGVERLTRLIRERDKQR